MALKGLLPAPPGKGLLDIPGVMPPQKVQQLEERKQQIAMMRAMPSPVVADAYAVEVAVRVVAGQQAPPAFMLSAIRSALFSLQTKGTLGRELLAVVSKMDESARSAYVQGAIEGRWALLMLPVSLTSDLGGA